MLGHLSFLFEPRTGNVDGNQLTIQTRLCKDVLDNIILAAAHKLRNQLTPAIWDIWIRLLIGIVDSIFMNKAKVSAAVHAVLCKSLSAPAFRVLLEVLLLSQNQDQVIWNSIVSLAVNWIRTPVVHHWCSAVNALTLRALALMYGPKFGGLCGTNLMIEWIAEDKGSVKSTLAGLDNEFIFFAWRRFVALLPEPHKITEPEVFRTFFQGVSVMVNHYSKVMNDGPHCPRASTQRLPNGNSILALVGRWLFNALLTDRPTFEDGTSIAARVACQLFCRTPVGQHEPPFQREYLASFYAALARILTKPHTDQVLRTVLNSTKGLFLREYPGSEMLIPSYLYAGAALWREPNTDPMVRISFIELLSSIVCITDNLTDAKIVSKLSFEIAYGTSQQRVPPIIAQFTTLRQHYQVLLSTALSKEDTSRNVVRLLSLIVAFLHDYSKNAASGAERETYILFASSTINEIVRKSRDIWPADVVAHAYTSLSNIAHLMTALGNNANLVVKLVLGSIAEHIMLLTSNPAREAAEKDQQDKTVYRAILTLTDWWMTDPNLPSIIDTKTVQNVIKAIVSCLGLPGKSPYNAPVTVKAAADFALHQFMTSASFPHSVGPQRVSSEISEDDIVSMIPNVDTKDPTVSQHCRYFVLDEHIIMCIIDVPLPVPDPNPQQEPQLCDVYIILRDATGRFVWKTKPSFYERESALNPVYDNKPSTHVTKEPVIKDRYEIGVQEELYTDLVGYLNSLRADRLYAGGLMSHAKTYVDAEKSHLNSSSFGLDVDIKLKLPDYKPPYESNLRFHSGRVLLSNLGFTHPDTYGRLVPLDARPGLHTALKALDSTIERSVMSVGVILLQQMPQKPYEFLADDSSGPQDYQDFLTSIGWGINLWEHTGYRGPLVASSAGDYAPYYADYSTELIFPVSNWIPNAETLEATITKKRKILANCPVLIIWSLTGEYDAPISQREYLHIVIQPLKSGLYRIRLVTKENRPLLAGPLTDNMKLSRRVLGPMVRMTAMTATRFLQPESNILAPCSIRKNRIEELSKAYQRPLAFDDWMMNIMSTRLAPDLTAPTHVPSTSISSAPISAFAQSGTPMRLAMENVDGFSTSSSAFGSTATFQPQASGGLGMSSSGAPTPTLALPTNSLAQSNSQAPKSPLPSASAGFGQPPQNSNATVAAPGANQATPTATAPVLTRTASSSMPIGAPPSTPGGNAPVQQGGLSGSPVSPRSAGSVTGPIPMSASLGVPMGNAAGNQLRTSAPSSPRAEHAGSVGSSGGDDGSRNRQHSTTSNSSDHSGGGGDTTPGRLQMGQRSTSGMLQPHPPAGHGLSHSHSSGDMHDSPSVNNAGSVPHSPGGQGRFGQNTTGPVPSAYKMPARTPPPAYNPPAGGMATPTGSSPSLASSGGGNTASGANTGATGSAGGPPPMPVTGSPGSQPAYAANYGGSANTATANPHNTSPNSGGAAQAQTGANNPSSSSGGQQPGGSYSAMGSSQSSARKPSSGFGSFFKKDKDKDKKPEEKKDPKKK